MIIYANLPIKSIPPPIFKTAETQTRDLLAAVVKKIQTTAAA